MSCSCSTQQTLMASYATCFNWFHCNNCNNEWDVGKCFSSYLYRKRWTFLSDIWIYRWKTWETLRMQVNQVIWAHTDHIWDLHSLQIKPAWVQRLSSLPSCYSPTSFAPDPVSRWEPQFSNTVSVLSVAPSGTFFHFPLQPNPQDSWCHHRSSYLCPRALKNLFPQQHSKASQWNNRSEPLIMPKDSRKS